VTQTRPTLIAEAYKTWGKAIDKRRSTRTTRQQQGLMEWNNEVYDKLLALMRGWITGETLTGSTKDQIGQLLCASCFFTGRRPWSETALGMKFLESESPEGLEPGDDWASGWLYVTGIAKLSEAQKNSGEVLDLNLYLLDLDVSDFLRGFQQMRDMFSAYQWYEPERPDGYLRVNHNMAYTVKKLMRGPILECFQPCIDKGYRVELAIKMFRKLYTDVGHWRHTQWADAHGQPSWGEGEFAQTFIGHSNASTTLQYMGWRFKGDQPISPARGT
jgi:hypothetical protein